MGDWLTEPFERYSTFLQETNWVLHLSKKGITQISRQMPLLEALDKLEKIRATADNLVRNPKNFEAQQKETNIAKQEIDKDFPLLHAHALVSVWSALEALFEDVIVAHIINTPFILKHEAFQKIKIPLATYEQLTQEDKARWLVYEFQRTLSSQQRSGIDCFEELLKIVGLAGKTSKRIRRDVYEIQQLRHTIVHRASLADRKLIEACSWLKLKSGDRVTISNKRYSKLLGSAQKYVTLVIKRATAVKLEKRKQVNKIALAAT